MNKLTDLNALKRSAALKMSNSDSPETDASELIGFVFGFSKTDILMNPTRELLSDKLQFFYELVEKRASGYPLQYILGEWDFFGLTFNVEEGVLIPRTETEQICDEACKFLSDKKNSVVFDICSGSGCIGLSIAYNNPNCRVFLFDISEKAVDVSEINKKKYSLDNVTILNYDIFSGFNKTILPSPDVILCNPPYVDEEEYKSLQKEIFFEPKNAITAPGDALGFYRCLADKWLGHLNEGGFFMFECGEEQPSKITEIIKKSDLNNLLKIKTENDIFGICRFVSGIKTEAYI